MMKTLRLALCFVSAVASFLVHAGIEGATTSCTPGTWTTSLDNARKVGKANKRFIAIAWGKSAGCAFCDSAASSVFNKAAFKKWSKDNGIPILWADDLDAGSCSDWIWQKYYGGAGVSFAQFLLIDPSNSDKLVLKSLFQGATVQYGTSSKAATQVTGCPNAWMLTPFNPSQTIGMIDWVIGKADNAASSAVTVVPDGLKATSLTVNGLWNTYGKHSLSCENGWSSSSQVPKIKLVTHAEDQFNWSKFTAAAAGAYEVKLLDYVDSHNEGQVYVFQDAATAKAVTTYALAAEKAMASCPMATVAEKGGWRFSVPAAGTYYLLFTRPDSEKCKQKSTGGVEYDGYVEKTLEYNYTLQEAEAVDSGDYWFSAQLSSKCEGETNELVVTRSEVAGAGSVDVVICAKDQMTDIPLATPEQCDQAVKGAPGVGDYYLIDANGKVLEEVRADTYACPFAAGEAEGRVRIVFNRGTAGIQRRDRAFGLRLDVATEDADGRYHEVFVKIEDADKPTEESEGALNATETPQRPANNYSLNGQNVSHTYFFTNVAHQAGSVYGFFVQAAGAHDFKDGRLKVEVVRTSTGERLVPVASNLYDAQTSTIAAGDSGAYVTYIYGTDSVDGFGPDGATTDVVIRVSRAAAAPGEFPDVRYWMQWQRFDRPVVSFDEKGVSYKTENRPESVTASLAIDTLSAIRAFHKPFALDVVWKTASPSAGSAAEENVDYIPVTDGRETYTNDNGTVSVDLCRQETLSYPTRSFVLKLGEDPNRLYVIGGKASGYTVTFEADNVAPCAAGVIEISGTDWQSTGTDVRNLNYRNVEDWITVSNVKDGGCYRLKAQDVLALPDGMETNVTVTVCTNGVPNGSSFRLADLILKDEAQAPVLAFGNLAGATVQLKVSRKADEQVRVEYRLAMREEADAGLDAADAYDDTRAGAEQHPIAIASDGAETNLVRLLNGTASGGSAVNDTDDWFRFSGVVPGETYRFAVKDVSTNVSVRAEFYRGDESEPFASVSLGELTREGFRYDATSTADVMVRVRREPAEGYALVKYTLGASRYIWPVVGFTADSVTVTNAYTNAQLRVGGAVTLAAYCHFNANRPVVASVSAACTVPGWGNDVYLAGVRSSTRDDFLPAAALTFNPAEAVTNEFEMGFRSVDNSWVGDWSFDITLNVDTNWCRYGEISKVRVTVIDQLVSEKDPTDGPDGDDFRPGAAPLDCGSGMTGVYNHLNGIDVPHGGVLSTDTNDWFRLTGLEAGNTYRLSIPFSIVYNIAELGFSVTVESETFTKTVSGLSLKEGYLDVPSPTGKDVFIRMARTTSGEEKPVAVAYALQVKKIEWPEFSIAAEQATVRNDAGVARAVVTRSDLFDGTDTVVVKVVDTNDVAVTVVPFEKNVVFATGETNRTVEVELVPAEAGYWKRGGSFRFVLERSPECPSVTLGETNAVVTVTDASGIPENDYAEDDEQEGAQVYGLDVAERSATGHLAPGQSVAWLNGGDLVDWYCLTNASAGTRYRIGITSFGSVNAEDCPPQIAIFDGESFDPIEEEIGKDGCWSWDYTPSVDGDIWVKVWRDADASADVSVRYLLTFRRLSPAYVRLSAPAQTVSGAAAAVYADVECVVANGEELFEDAVVTVCPCEDVGAVAPAKPDQGFEATPVTLTWAAGSTGGVRRIAVPIAGSSATWKGQETFLLVLSNVTDAAEIAAPENGGQQRVTIEDVATPVYGSVGITQAGADISSLVDVTASSVLNAREGGAVVVSVTRVGGQAGRVDGVWTWKDGSKQVGDVVKRQLFAGVTAKEPTTVDVGLTVPTVAGYQAKRTLTLVFAIETAKAKTVTITKGTPTSLKVAVTDKDYGAAISAYSADDPAKVCFKANGAAWFLDTAGGVRAAVTAGATQKMTASVTGPGTLVYDVTLAGGCTLTVTANGKKLETIYESKEDEPVHVDAQGAATIEFLCTSPKTLPGDACCAVSDVRFVRDDAANRFGTYNGRALVGGKPGAATLTVSQAGKISGKIICADRTWTFSSTGGWSDGNTFKAMLKSGQESLPEMTFRLMPSTGAVMAYEEDENEPVALFARNVWADKPLSAAAARAYGNCVGYLTAVLPPESDANGPLYGSGYCGLTVSKSGAVRAAGRLADGQALSVSATLVPAEDGTVGDGVLASAFLFARPGAYKGGWYFASPEFRLRDFGAGGERVVISNAVRDAVLESAAPWTSSEVRTFFERTPGFVGGWYDKAENLYGHYAAGLSVAEIDAVSSQTIAGKTCAATAWATDEEHPVSLAFNASGSRLTATCGGGDRLFTVSLTRATGLFSGSFRATYDYMYGGVGRTTTKSFAYQGMLVPYAPEGETAAGRGYFLMPEKNGQGLTVNRSYEIEIGEEE